MAGGKESPRQKMIGLMYLVLTAMLALNVSKAILKGYLSINDSVEQSKKNMMENNQRVYEAFKATIEHEIMENFKVDGIILFNHHINFEELLKISNNEVKRN